MTVTWQIKPDCLTTVTRCTLYCNDDTGSVCHAAAIHVVVQCWQFPDKNFIEYLIIISPDVKHFGSCRRSFPLPTLICGKFYYTRAAPKVMPPILLCWPTTSEADVGGMAVEVDPSRQYSVEFFCRATDDSRGAV